MCHPLSCQNDWCLHSTSLASLINFGARRRRLHAPRQLRVSASEGLTGSLPEPLSASRSGVLRSPAARPPGLAPRQAGSRQVCPVTSECPSSGLSVSGFIPRFGLLHLLLILLVRRILDSIGTSFHIHSTQQSDYFVGKRLESVTYRSDHLLIRKLKEITDQVMYRFRMTNFLVLGNRLAEKKKKSEVLLAYCYYTLCTLRVLLSYKRGKGLMRIRT